MRNKIETFLSTAGLVLLLFVLPTWSYVSAAPTFKSVTGGAVGAVDHISLLGFDPTTCPAGRITRADIKYPNVPPSSATRRNVDVTQFANIWGHADTRDTAVPYPGRSGAVPSVSGWGPPGRYIAAQFVAPVSNTYNQLGFSTYSALTTDPLRVDAAVSTQCSAFASARPHCSIRNVGPGDALLKLTQLPRTNGCGLVTGRTYYFNLRPVDGHAASGFMATNNTVGNQP